MFTKLVKYLAKCSYYTMFVDFLKYFTFSPADTNTPEKTKRPFCFLPFPQNRQKVKGRPKNITVNTLLKLFS